MLPCRPGQAGAGAAAAAPGCRCHAAPGALLLWLQGWGAKSTLHLDTVRELAHSWREGEEEGEEDEEEEREE